MLVVAMYLTRLHFGAGGMAFHRSVTFERIVIPLFPRILIRLK
jgi:hypothetical protein